MLKTRFEPWMGKTKEFYDLVSMIILQAWSQLSLDRRFLARDLEGKESCLFAHGLDDGHTLKGWNANIVWWHLGLEAGHSRNWTWNWTGLGTGCSS